MKDSHRRRLQIECCKQPSCSYANYSFPLLASIITSQVRHFRGERQLFCGVCCEYKWLEDVCQYYEEGTE